MTQGVWLGMDRLQATLSRLPKEVKQSPVLRAAATKALLPVKAGAKARYSMLANGSMDGYSKAKMLSRSVVVRPLKRSLGARVVLRGGKMVTGTRQGTPIRWGIWQYGRLLSNGAKGERFHRGTRKSTGSFRGKGGDPIASTGRIMESSVRAEFYKALVTHVNKKING